MPMIQIDEGLCMRSEDIRYICNEPHLIECSIGTKAGEIFRSSTPVSKIFDLINQAEGRKEDAFKS